jgi:hypothetical protein
VGCPRMACCLHCSQPASELFGARGGEHEAPEQEAPSKGRQTRRRRTWRRRKARRIRHPLRIGNWDCLFVLISELRQSRPRVPKNCVKQAAEKSPEGSAEARARESQQAIKPEGYFSLFSRKMAFHHPSIIELRVCYISNGSNPFQSLHWVCVDS